METLPPFPPIAVRLLRLMSEETAAYQEVAKLIRSDATFTAEVLRLANSALFGFRHEVVSVLHGISVLGVERLKGLVLTVAMRDFLFNARHHDVLKRCWRHNLACALLAERLADDCWFDRAFAYTAGLLHDIGRLAMVASQPERYAKLIAEAERGSVDLLECERQAFGIDHCEAGGCLVEDWGLPGEFAEIAATHHHVPDGDKLTMSGLVHVTCQLADMLGFPVAGQPPAWEPEKVQRLLPESARGRLSAQSDEVATSIACKINLFDCDFFVERRTVRL